MELADLAGVTMGGANSDADIRINNSDFFRRITASGVLGFGESYVDGDWDCDRLDLIIEKAVQAKLHEKVNQLTLVWPILQAKLANLQTVNRSFQIGRVHYDIDYFLFEGMLDKRMTYSCAYWKDAQDLDSAQEAKLDLVCRKIGLKAGDRVLDIGCGWGSFMKYAAENYGASVVGLTVSKEQARMGAKNCQGLPVEFLLQDYRRFKTKEKFDHIVCIDMFTHVGPKNHRTFMKKVASLLKDDGLFLLQTIGGRIVDNFQDPWIYKYILPNSYLANLRSMAKAIDDIFLVEDLHNFGCDYSYTFLAWYKNFSAIWPSIQHQYSDRFYRMWSYYLQVSAGSFSARNDLQLWQILMSKNGVIGGHRSIR